MKDLPFGITETANGLRIRIHVQPRARRTELAGIHDGVLKIRIAAPPVDGSANRAIADYFAALLDVQKSRVRVASGMKSRDKTLLVEGVSLDKFSQAVTFPPRQGSSESAEDSPRLPQH